MFKFIEKLKRRFNGEAEIPAKKKPTGYELGLTGTPAEAAQYTGSFDVIKGASDALRQGRPELIVAMLSGVKEFQEIRFPMTGDVIYEPRGDTASRILANLTADEIKTAVASLPQEQKDAILGEALAYITPQNKGPQMDALIGAGADVDYGDGLPLREAASAKRTGAIQRLANAGASFEKAIKAAQTREDISGGDEVARRLKIYQAGMPYALNDTAEHPIMPMPGIPPAVM